MGVASTYVDRASRIYLRGRFRALIFPIVDYELMKMNKGSTLSKHSVMKEPSRLSVT